MRRALCGLTLAIGSILVTPGQALAGGSWMEWDAPAYAPGQTAVGIGDFYRGCCDRGTLKDGPYFAYLVPPSKNDHPIPPLPGWSINLAPLSIVDHDPRWETTVSFTVPDVPSGYYNVILCNDPCTDVLGDSMGNGFTIASSPARAEVQPLVQRLRRQMGERIRHLRVRIGKLEAENRELERATDQRIDLLSDRVSDLEHASPTEEDRSPEPGTAAVLGVLGIGALAWLIRRAS